MLFTFSLLCVITASCVEARPSVTPVGHKSTIAATTSSSMLGLTKPPPCFNNGVWFLPRCRDVGTAIRCCNENGVEVDRGNAKTDKEVATTRPTRETTVPSKLGCYHWGKVYPLGKNISSGNDGRSWCFGEYCNDRGEVLMWDDWGCSTTISSTTNIPTPRLTTREMKPQKSTEKNQHSTWKPETASRVRHVTYHPTSKVTVTRKIQRSTYAGTTVPPRTTPFGCYYQGKHYPPGRDISSGYDGRNWCYGAYCDRTGQIIMWDNFQCMTTTARPTNVPTEPTTFPKPGGCRYNGRWYPPNSEISRGSSYGWCHGTICDRDGQILMWDDWRCSTTQTPYPPTRVPTPPNPPATTPTTNPTPRPTTPLQTDKVPVGCYYENTLYATGSEILKYSDGNGRCHGRICSNDSQLVSWSDFNCKQELATQGCSYGGHMYRHESELFRRDGAGKCFAGICDGSHIKAWKPLSCEQENGVFAGTLFQSSQCSYRGQMHSDGSVVLSKALYKSHGYGWCVGAKCDNGRIVTWGPHWAPGYC